ncbi:hypothetical protein [Streptomyces sp. NPDC088812]|uniref:hypothetical protein n=1 Tax=Streptomyces sp. NPDC088812 TaxID=3365905 RepID=UPI0037F988A0
MTANELTLHDVESFAAFLVARLDELRAAHKGDADVRRLVLAFRLILDAQMEDARAAFGYGGPLASLSARRRQWNKLVRFGAAWKRCAGYHASRWQHVWHDDAADAARAADARLARL